jgi:type IV fimbrial biogenesis protein FimT
MDGNPRKKHAGASLIELITAVVVLALLVGIALPSLSGLVRRHRLQTAQTEYMATLQYARTTAVSESSRTIFCPSHDGHQCSDDNDWTQGWLVGSNGTSADQPDGEPLRVSHDAHRQLTVLGISERKRQYVTFQPSGTAGGSNLTLVLCHRGDPNGALTVVVSNSGRIRGELATEDKATTCATAG